MKSKIDANRLFMAADHLLTAGRDGVVQANPHNMKSIPTQDELIEACSMLLRMGFSLTENENVKQ